MIIVSEAFKNWTEGFSSQEEAAKHLGVSRQWLSTVLSGKGVGEEFIELVKSKTGFDFERAFTIIEADGKP